MNNDKIDFVITWVDGSDKNWINERLKYSNEKKDDESSSVIRYRDWGLLKYWFRGVEKYANWVNKIYFVTCGQVPDWLNVENEKIVLVNHSDYIPKKYLPTFNSNVIELFFNRIPNLSNKFVYFNDDVLIFNQLSPTDFFLENMVRDRLIFNSVSVNSKNSIIEHTILNNLELLAKYFTKQEVEKNNKGKIYTIRNGKKVIKSFLMKPWKNFTGIENAHTAMPYIKSTWDKVWHYEEKQLLTTANNKFRTKYDYNHWIFKYWQMFEGNFALTNYDTQKYYDLCNDNSAFFSQLKDKKIKIACINDSDDNIDFKKVKYDLNLTLQSIYPEKSSFEK